MEKLVIKLNNSLKRFLFSIKIMSLIAILFSHMTFSQNSVERYNIGKIEVSGNTSFSPITIVTFSGLKEEIETIVSLRVDKVIKKMNLVKKDEFDVLKKMVQKLVIQNEKLMKSTKSKVLNKKKTVKKAKFKKKQKKGLKLSNYSQNSYISY